MSFSACVTTGTITPSVPSYTRVLRLTSSTFASAADQLAASFPAWRAAATAAASHSTTCRSFSLPTGTLPIRDASLAAPAKSCTTPSRHSTSRAPGDTRANFPPSGPIPSTASAGHSPPAPLAQK